MNDDKYKKSVKSARLSVVTEDGEKHEFNVIPEDVFAGCKLKVSSGPLHTIADLLDGFEDTDFAVEDTENEVLWGV